MMGRDKLVSKLAVSRRRNVILLEVVCSDEYAAVVLEDDLLDRLKKGQGISLNFTQERAT